MTHIIIENGVAMTEFFKIEERIVRAKVLKLNHELREGSSHLVHEFFHKLGHDLGRDTLLAKTEVEGIIKEFLGVGSEIKGNGDSRLGSDTISHAIAINDGSMFQ